MGVEHRDSITTGDGNLWRAVAAGTAVAWAAGAALLLIVSVLRHLFSGFEGSVGETAVIVVGAVALNLLAGAVAARFAAAGDQGAALLAGALSGISIGVTTIAFGLLTRHALEVAGFHARLSDLSGSASGGATLGLLGAAIWYALRRRTSRHPAGCQPRS